MPRKIFIVEDEKNIQELVKYNLESEGYIVEVFQSGEALLLNNDKNIPDMYVLDIMLPGMDGYDICRKIREDEKTREIPIIMLTAKNDEFDKVLGLELGADDYITKPFGIKEFLARVRVIFRRTEDKKEKEVSSISYRDLEMDIKKYEVKKKGLSLKLTHKEFELLKFLLLNKGNVLTREMLLDKVWGMEYYGESRTVDVHVRYLRKKIEDENKPKYIETVRGVGYKLSDIDY
jgi:two-component system alkaline phosphatase synthesis response regulator PhoP